MLCDYTAGWISGVVSVLIGHPFDTIKTQQQIRSIPFSEAAKRILRHRGWKGYYRGLLVPLLTTGTLNAIFFGLYGDIRDYLIASRLRKDGIWPIEDKISSSNYVPKNKQTIIHDAVKQINKPDEESATFTELFIAGSLAGSASLVLAAPVELVKTKLQSQMKRKMFRGPRDCFTTIIREAGIRGIYRGIVPMALRDGPPGGGIYFVAYEAFKHKFESPNDPVRGLIVQSMGGGLAGCASWALVLPFDTIKSRLQADHHVTPHYRGMCHCAAEIYRCDGLVGLYRGFWSCAARAIPVNAAIFLVYEYFSGVFCRK